MMNSLWLRLSVCAYLLSACGNRAPQRDLWADDKNDGDATERETAENGPRGGVTLLISAPDTGRADSESDRDTDTSLDRETDEETDAPPHYPQIPFDELTVMLNPYGRAPLTAVVKVSHPLLDPREVMVMRVTVEGLDEADEDLNAVLYPTTDAYQRSFDISDLLEEGEVGIPVLGLFHDALNHVHVAVETPSLAFSGETDIQTERLSALEGEVVSVDVLVPKRMEPGLTFLNDRVYDNRGNCRWKGPKIYRLLENGNILIGLDEWSWLGKSVVNRSL